MPTSEFAKIYLERMFGDFRSRFAKTDPEFASILCNFTFDEVVNAEPIEGSTPLDDKTRFLAILAALLGSQSHDAFHLILPAALKLGVTPTEIKELVYQGVPYLGIGRVFTFLKIVNAVLEESGVKLPLEPQGSTSPDDRVEKGNQKQIDYFGEGMREFWKNAPEGQENINYWLAGNCFGDYYTRGGLDDRQREMITFCFLASQGGCESQLIGHALGNMRLGASKRFLFQVVEQCLPYIGYPRSLNAISAIKQAASQLEGK